MNITEKIHQLRREKGWSVARLARVCGIPTVSLRAMLARQEKNSYNVKSLQRLAKALGVSVSYLTLEEGESLKPKITAHQKREIIKKIDELIESYFQVEDELNDYPNQFSDIDIDDDDEENDN